MKGKLILWLGYFVYMFEYEITCKYIYFQMRRQEILFCVNKKKILLQINEKSLVLSRDRPSLRVCDRPSLRVFHGEASSWSLKI